MLLHIHCTLPWSCKGVNLGTGFIWSSSFLSLLFLQLVRRQFYEIQKKVYFPNTMSYSCNHWLLQKAIQLWDLHFQCHFHWQFWTISSYYITVKRWYTLKSCDWPKKLVGPQVFKLGLSSVFDQNNSSHPTVAIVVPYRSFFPER